MHHRRYDWFVFLYLFDDSNIPISSFALVDAFVFPSFLRIYLGDFPVSLCVVYLFFLSILDLSLYLYPKEKKLKGAWQELGLKL